MDRSLIGCGRCITIMNRFSSNMKKTYYVECHRRLSLSVFEVTFDLGICIRFMASLDLTA